MDFIDEFMKETESIHSPKLFRLWTAITILAGVLERRVWTHTDVDPLYPNIFAVLTGSPAAGKSICINIARRFWAEVKELHLGPDNPTKASFLDCLEAAIRPMDNGIIFSAMSVPCRELGVLIAKHDLAFLSDLTDIYDNPHSYTSPRRTSKSLDIQRPTINILAAATPDFLYELIPEVAWNQGFTSRLLFIYSEPVHDRTRNIFAKRKHNAFDGLIKFVQIAFKHYGEFEWDEDAKDFINDWNNKGLHPRPQHSKLLHYCGRRMPNVLKLSMISAVAAGNFPFVKLNDVLRAKDWLLEAENAMPDIFMAMVQKSDTQLLSDVHMVLYANWSRIAMKDRVPVKEHEVWAEFEKRALSERIPKLIEMMLKTNRLKRGKFPDEYIPGLLNQVIDT